MNRFKFLLGIAVVTMAFSACNNDDFNIGTSLTDHIDKLTTTAASFNVTTRTVIVDSVISRTNECYFGRIKDPETGAYISNDFMSQFHILETFALADPDSVVSKVNGQVVADSCDIIVYMKDASTFCDSLAAMKLRVSELATAIDEDQIFYSNYDPVKLGLLRKDGLVHDKMFSWTDLIVSESNRSKTDYFNNIRIPINDPYTDKNGETYSNYGTYVLQQYYRHPKYFKNSYTFMQNVCPGFFFEITDGLGFHTKVPYTGIQIYYRIISNDSIYNTSTALAGTSEVLQTTRITNERERLAELAKDQTCSYLKSPAGLFTEVTIPVDEIMSNHTTDSLLSAKLSFQRLNNNVHDNTVLTIPENVLLICKDSLDNFFAKGKLADSKTSYTTSFTASGANQYTFSNISNLITYLAKTKAQGMSTDLHWTANHPNWNKLILVPIHLQQVSTTSAYGVNNTTTIGIEHNLGISSTKLVGGDKNPNNPITIDVVFGKFE